MKPNLTVIKGGKTLAQGPENYLFLSGYVTDTRLMGVIGMELKWHVVSEFDDYVLNQIFYLDAEEYGLESYTEAYGDCSDIIRAERNRLIGALGGNIVPVDEEEARFILQSYIKINKKYKQSLPDGYEKYKFMLFPEQAIPLEKYERLFERISGYISYRNYILNYYLMRTFAKDLRGVAFLTAQSALKGELPSEEEESGETRDAAGDTATEPSQREETETAEPVMVTPDYIPEIPDCDIYPKGPPATMCRNTIELYGDPKDWTFMCESVVEYNNRYHIVTSELKLQRQPCRVLSARKCSSFPITSIEAAMIMNCSEFITVYEVDSQSAMFRDAFSAYSETFTETSYDTGRLYIDFFDTNGHVGRPVYRINDDIRAMYYLTDNDQLLVIAYSFEAVFEAELHVTLAMMPNYMQLLKKYEFREPIIYEFIKSNFDDFNEFLSLVCKKPEL